LRSTSIGTNKQYPHDRHNQRRQEDEKEHNIRWRYTAAAASQLVPQPPLRTVISKAALSPSAPITTPAAGGAPEGAAAASNQAIKKHVPRPRLPRRYRRDVLCPAHRTQDLTIVGPRSCTYQETNLRMRAAERQGERPINQPSHPAVELLKNTIRGWMDV
jgi:hypothetical protein